MSGTPRIPVAEIWCLDYNYFEANNKNLDMVKAREIPRWRDSDLFSPLERQVLAYAEAMTTTEPTVTDEMVASLRTRLGDAAAPQSKTSSGMALAIRV